MTPQRWQVVFAVMACLVLTGCTPNEPIRLGFLAGLSGRGADLGEAGRDGALLALAHANAGGGVDGRKLELHIRDDGQKSETAIQAIDELAAKGVVAVIGPMTSAMALAVVPAIEKSGLVLISPTVTTKKLSGLDDNFFKVVSTTREHARLGAEYQHAQGRQRIAAIYDLANAAYTQDWLEDFSQAFAAVGGTVVQSEPFTSGQESSHAEAINRLKAVQADALLFISNAVDTVRLLQAARTADLQQPAVGVTWAATEQLIELGGRTVEGLALSQFFDRDNQTPRYLAFRTAYQTRFQKEPGFASVAAYDATMATIEALRRKGARSLKEALLVEGPFEGAQEKWNFDRHGDAQRKAMVTIVRDGRFVVVN
jgi:branched-chain amino acid transport system substrate-binding protein